MCFRIELFWHCHLEHLGCMGKMDKLTEQEPLAPQFQECEQAKVTGQRCREPRVTQQHLAICCEMHHSRRIRQLEGLWKDEWKNQVFDHFARKQHLSDREKVEWQRARDFQKERWTQFQEALLEVYVQFGNRLNAAVVGALHRTLYERIEQTMLMFVESVRRQCILEPESRERARKEAAAAAAAIAAASGLPPPPIPPRSTRRRQRSTSVQHHQLPRIQQALVQMSLSGPAGGSAPAQTPARPLPPTPTPTPAAGQAGSSSSSASSVVARDDDAAAIAAVASVEHAFRAPSPAPSSSDEASDTDSDSDSDATVLGEDL
ncbi:hypothetical protein B0T20DRAFT_343877 [Sordaria brevicollis]|uniref:Uncharacterized protein n=1 Tax=Sordaria brevicollis TaxID=83679 RepID=A0AAE0PMK0_SORBR|nr:hypothetical protein B0T20DRAFT_343877 [Sordaria brevicollis]